MVSDYIGTLENVSITRRTTSMKYNILNSLFWVGLITAFVVCLLA